MKTIEQRKLKLDVMEDAIEALEKVVKNNYEWEKEYFGFDEANIEEWSEDKKLAYERLSFKEAVMQSFINYIENTKV